MELGYLVACVQKQETFQFSAINSSRVHSSEANHYYTPIYCDGRSVGAPKYILTDVVGFPSVSAYFSFSWTCVNHVLLQHVKQNSSTSFITIIYITACSSNIHAFIIESSSPKCFSLYVSFHIFVTISSKRVVMKYTSIIWWDKNINRFIHYVGYRENYLQLRIP